jgi:hypothetical protein
MRDRSGQRGTISTTMLSLLGMQGKMEELISQGEKRHRWDRNEQKVLTTNPVDVFILAMIKPSDIGKIEIDKYSFNIDSSLITLFISEEKYAKKGFLEENYNKTVAKYLRASVNEFIFKHNIKTEVVPDNIFKQYYRNPYSIENNSVFELMEIDKQVKEKAFSNIKGKILVRS